MVSTKGTLWDYCPFCDKSITLTQRGAFRIHGRPNNRCQGSGYIRTWLMRLHESRGNDA